MEVREIEKQNELDSFVGNRTGCQFLQSWRWGEFQRAVPRPVRRWGAFDGQTILGTAQAFEHRLPLGKKYWYIPRGPMLDDRLPVDKYGATVRSLLETIMDQAENHGVMFLKVEPPWEKTNEALLTTVTQGWQIKKVDQVQPAQTWFLDLGQSEEQLLAAMHPKTRYNIKLAERKGVHIRTVETVNDFDAFLSLTTQTAQRDKIRTHSHDYYRIMHRTLAGKNFLQLFSAEYEGKNVAGNIVIFFGDTVTYLHGASGDERREVMAPHLLQWRQIQEAKKRGYKKYDFGGVTLAHDNDAPHPWDGITRFKQGFGGYGAAYLGAFDLILDPVWYTIYKMAQKAIIR
ncbi:MAG: peptidoglycan bridge formation glycyltransferase FemA/FemB family protein [Patescibacteria group bacterium]